MTNLEKIIKNSISDNLKAFNSINDYVIEIGVISDKTKRKQSVGITNAGLMFIHEHGSPARSLPKRDVLQKTIKHASKQLLPQTINTIKDGCFYKNWTSNDVKLELEKLCIRMQNYARWIIFRSNLLEKNAQSTINKKHSDRPLLDTGLLVKSITCKLIKK